MKSIHELEKNITFLEDAKEKILSYWVSFDEVTEILEHHDISLEYFSENFASAIFDYYVGVVKKDKEIGDCPVMSTFLDYLNDHDISAAELFLICTHFRKAMLDSLFDLERMNRALFDEVSYVFDLNFSGVLDQYSGRIYSAQRETKVHKRRFEEYNLAIDHSAMVCKVNLNGIIVYANPRFSEMSGYSNAELIGTHMGVIQAQEKSHLNMDELHEQLQGKEIFHGILKNQTKSGKEYYTETTIVPMLNLDEEIEEYLAIGYDVSELIQTRDAALNAERVKDQFLANMSHEIRTPLNAILGFVSILRKRIKDEENSHYLDVIHTSGENLLVIIGDILDFAKIREGKLAIEKHQFDPIYELSNIFETFNAKMVEKNIDYLVYIDPFLPVRINADSTRIKQVIANFISNAVKFTPEQGSIRVRVMIHEGKLEISVKDSGCGIDKASLGRIFNAFEQAEGSTTRQYGGTGLGLSICQRLCEMMDGDIEVESEIGQGSLFRLIVPVITFDKVKQYVPHRVYLQEHDSPHVQLLKRYFVKMNMQLEAQPNPDYMNFYVAGTSVDKVKPYVLLSTTPCEHESYLMPAYSPIKIMQFFDSKESQKEKIVSNSSRVQFSGHVLVAEDNKANQMFMKLLLDEFGLTYVIASNGQEAYESFQEEKFSLVLIDEHMPILGGLDAAAKIMQFEADNKLQHTPIISVTANALKGDKERFLDAGMDGYVSKPIENAKLEEVLLKFIPYEGARMSQNLELPSYANLSAEEMAAKIGLNAKHIPILVQSFTDESTSILTDLEAAISAKNFTEIASTAHSIKGSSGNLKFTEMYELAKEMELSAKDSVADYPYEEAFASIKKAIESISL